MKTRSPKRSDPWQKVSLGDCGAWKSGGTPSTKEADYWDGDIPWFTSSSLTTFRLRESVRTLTQVGLENGSRLVQPGTVLFVVRGMSLNTEFRVGITQQPSAFGQDCKALIAADGINAEFLGYSLKAHEQVILGMVSHAAHGTGKLDTDFLQGLRIPMPPLEIQENVVGVLASLDDLIENNRRRIELLEETARLLYREWFVHFRYPGHEDIPLVESELGPIPQGWEVQRLVDVCHLTMGQSPKSKYYNEIGKGLPFHQGVKDFGLRYPTHSKWCTTDARIAEEGDILLSVRAPVGRINVAPDRMVIGRGLSAIRSANGQQTLLFEQLKNVFAKEDSMGGGTIFQSVTAKDLKEIRLLQPRPELCERLTNLIDPTFQLIKRLTDSNRDLSEIRDLLLPRLVSGDLDISGLELDLEAVG